MIKKGDKLYSIFHNKCPRCHEGEFFISHPYNLSKAGEIHTNCEVCGLKYSKEPGFYYGAMYVSYALGVAVFVMIWVLFRIFFRDIPTGWLIGTMIFVTLLLAPYLYALSKIIWANIFIKYDKNIPKLK